MSILEAFEDAIVSELEKETAIIPETIYLDREIYDMLRREALAQIWDASSQLFKIGFDSVSFDTAGVMITFRPEDLIPDKVEH